MKIVKTLCQMCNRYCGMNAYVEGTKMVKVEGMPEHPVSKGGLCAKGLSSVRYEYDPKRLIHPLKRVGGRGEGKWERISWDEAIGITAGALRQVKEKCGAQSIFFYKGQGNGWDSNWVHVRRFMNVLGSPNYGAHSHLCWIPFVMGQRYTMGGVTAPDIENTKCIVLWGQNPFCSNLGNLGQRIIDAKEKGTRLIVIDPRFNSAAAKADLFVRIRPGTDGALALGILNILLNEKKFDTEFTAKWTYGFDELEKCLQKYAPAMVEDITGVSAAIIREMARVYTTTKPACIIVGNGIEEHTNAVQTSRAIAILMAISGNLDQPGGNVFLVRPRLADIRLTDKLPPDVQAIDKHPLYYQIWGVPGSDLLDTLLSGRPYPIKAMIVMDGNPVSSLSESGRVRKALKKLDFLAVHEIFMTSTAEIADVVLPATTCFESSQFTIYPYNAAPPVNTNLVALREKVVDPPEECHSDYDFIFALARKLGCGNYYPWNTAEEAFEEELKPMGITIQDLKEHPEGIARSIDSQDLYRKYERVAFATPTKKVELYSTIFEKFGYDPLPTFKEPGESLISRPDLAKEYPLICGTGIKPVLYVQNQYRTVSWLNEIMPQPWVEIHPLRAKELGLKDGELAVVESQRGCIKVKAKLTQDIDPSTVFLPHGWGEPYAHGSADNDITPDSPRCPLSGSTANRAFLCRVRKA